MSEIADSKERLLQQILDLKHQLYTDPLYGPPTEAQKASTRLTQVQIWRLEASIPHEISDEEILKNDAAFKIRFANWTEK
jgi:hypothetical protein